jgi:hypothetical protein
MLWIGPCDADSSLEDVSTQQDFFISEQMLFFVSGDDKFTRPVYSIIFMITGGRIPSIMTNENG